MNKYDVQVNYGGGPILLYRVEAPSYDSAIDWVKRNTETNERDILGCIFLGPSKEMRWIEDEE